LCGINLKFKIYNLKFLNKFLLHGALGSAAHYDALKPLLPTAWQAHAFSFSGHGGRPFGPAFSNDALWKRPSRRWTGWAGTAAISLATAWAGMLVPEKIEAKVPAFAQALADRHAPNDWKELCRKTAGMMAELGEKNPLAPSNLLPLAHPVRICLGDADNMVSREESQAVAEALANGEFVLLGNTPHPLEKVDVGVLAQAAVEFFV
jgi:pimeloyl-ACP methyl ester carboxylesterase